MAAFFSEVDAAWLSAQLGREVKSLALDEVDLEKLNKLNCMRFAVVEYADGRSDRLVIKMSAPSESSQLLGLAREAYWYRDWRSLVATTAPGDDDASKPSSGGLEGILPRVLFSSGSMATGEKVLVMEDLSVVSVQLGHLFGAGNPNNWGKDLEALTSKLSGGPIGVPEATRLAFCAAARLHASYWGNSDLLLEDRAPWLRGAAWLCGNDKQQWMDTQANTAALWSQVKAKMGDTNYTVRWDPLLVAVVDASVARAAGEAGWERYQAELRARPFTLVHGDFHPANVLLEPGSRVVLVDWEAVGLGSGPQELGQFMISHTLPAVRASIEREAVAAYHAELCRCNAAVAPTLSLADCWQEYVLGGLARWLFFLPFDGWGAPPAVSQFFCDQVLAWVSDHGITANDAPMPRL